MWSLVGLGWGARFPALLFFLPCVGPSAFSFFKAFRRFPLAFLCRVCYTAVVVVRCSSRWRARFFGGALWLLLLCRFLVVSLLLLVVALSPPLARLARSVVVCLGARPRSAALARLPFSAALVLSLPFAARVLSPRSSALSSGLAAARGRPCSSRPPLLALRPSWSACVVLGALPGPVLCVAWPPGWACAPWWWCPPVWCPSGCPPPPRSLALLAGFVSLPLGRWVGWACVVGLASGCPWLGPRSFSPRSAALAFPPFAPAPWPLSLSGPPRGPPAGSCWWPGFAALCVLARLRRAGPAGWGCLCGCGGLVACGLCPCLWPASLLAPGLGSGLLAAWAGLSVSCSCLACRRVRGCRAGGLCAVPSSSPLVGFCGSRSLPASFAPAVARAVAGAGSVAVGCAAGADALVRSSALSLGRPLSVFSVASGRFGSGRSAFARRSVACVRSVAAVPGAAFVGFVSSPCPPGAAPARSWRSGRPVSGSWSSLALAAGLGLPVFVFWCGAPAGWLPVPSAWGSWSAVPAGPFAGAFLLVPPPALF